MLDFYLKEIKSNVLSSLHNQYMNQTPDLSLS